MGILEFRNRKLFPVFVEISVSGYLYIIYNERKQQICKNKENIIGGFCFEWNHWHDLHFAAGHQKRVLLF